MRMYSPVWLSFKMFVSDHHWLTLLHLISGVWNIFQCVSNLFKSYYAHCWDQIADGYSIPNTEGKCERGSECTRE
jgi:hypothetical protein